MATVQGKHAKHARGASQSAWDLATAGTYVDRAVPRAFTAFVLVVALVAPCIPFIGMLWARTDSTTENRELAAAPVLFAEDGAFNWAILSDAGTYFEDHFAYRNQLVATNARMRAAIGVSPTDQIVVGDDGWLYYGGTLYDYLGQSALSDRALSNVAHNLSLVQRYVEAHGAKFVFTLAPNKNTLYADHMPYYYMATPEASNAERLKPYLDQAGVNYVDLFELFDEKDSSDPLYLKRDTHWDNRGALVASQALLRSVGRDAIDLEISDAVARDDFTGDLEAMLYPSGAQTEPNWYFEGYNDGEGFSGSSWVYEEGADVTDASIATSSNVGGTGNLLMFRDWFGNALVPLWASLFERATFSKLVPYDVSLAISTNADVVVVERAERHLAYLAQKAPLMPSPASSGDETVAALPVSEEGQDTTLEAKMNGPYVVLSGAIDERLASSNSEIFVQVDFADGTHCRYNAFWLSIDDEQSQANDSDNQEQSQASDFGYQVNITGKRDALDGATVRVLVENDGTTTCAKEFSNITIH